MALTPLEETNINALLVSMFNSSAANYFQEIENFFLANGNDLSLLAKQLGTVDIFEAQFSGLSNVEQAESMLQRFGLTNDNVTGSAGSVAYAYFIKSIEDGVNPSDILLAASNYLTNITGRDPIFKDTATLLENKASVAQELSDRGVIYSELSAEVLTLVTLDLNSVSTAKAIVNLIPAGTTTVTAAMQNTLSSIMDNVKSMAASGTTEDKANVATYLALVATQISTATPTSLASILTAINSVTTAALTLPTVLENPSSLATSTTTNPDTIGTTIEAIIESPAITPATTFTVIEDGSGVVTFGGTATGEISIAWAGTVNASVATFTRAEVVASTTADFNAAGTATSIALGAAQVLSTTAVNVTGVIINGATGGVTLTDTTLSVAALNALNANITAIITATVTTGTTAALSALTGTGNAYTTVATGSATAVNLAVIDATTTLAVDATLVTDISGLAADIIAVVNSAGVTLAANWNSTLTTGAASAAEIATIEGANGSGIINGSALTDINGSIADITQALTDLETDPTNFNTAVASGTEVATTLTALNTTNGTGGVTATAVTGLTGTVAEINAAIAAVTSTPTAYTAILSAGTEAATDLTTLAGVAGTTVNAAAVTNITGTTIEISAALTAINASGSNSGTEPTNSSMTVTGTASATDLTTLASANTLDASGVMVINGTAAEINATFAAMGTAGSTLPTTYTVTLAAAAEIAADVTTLAGQPGLTLNAAAVTQLTGTVTEIEAAHAAVSTATGTDMADYIAILSAGTEVATALTALNTTNGTGVIIATAVTSLTGTVAEINATIAAVASTPTAYTAILSAGAEAATDLTTLAGVTGTTVNAAAVTNITGTAAEIAAVQASPSITKPAGWITQPTAGTAAATDLIAIDFNNSTAVDASLITTITGTAAEIAAVQAAPDIIKPAGWITQPTAGTAAAADLITIDFNNSTAVDASLITTITGTTVEINAAYAAQTATTITGLATNLNITVTGSPTAAEVNALAALTTGTVTATIATSVVAGMTTALSNVDAADVITFEVSDNTTIAPTDLSALVTKVDNLSLNLSTAAIAVSGTTATAIEIATLATLTTGAVTATIVTGAVSTVNAVKADLAVTDIITFTTDDVTGVDASDLVDINDLVDTGVYTSITDLTETYNTAGLVAEITNALAITTGGAETITISGGSQSYAVPVGDLNAIAALTTGIVTARISAQSGTGMAGHLSNIEISDVITYAIFNGLTFSAGDLSAIVSKVDNLSLRIPNDNYVVTGATATAEEINTLAVLATGTITSAVAADEASILNTALTDSDINNALTITTTNVATDIADLIALNSKTMVDVDASAVVTITSAATTTIDLTAAGVTWASGINVTGTAQGDTITTTSGTDIINGGTGADIIDGGMGDDDFVYLLTADLFGTQTTTDTSLAGGIGTDDELLIGTTGTTFAIANNDVWAGVTTVETITAIANAVAVTVALDVTAYAAGIRTVDLSLADSGANSGNVIDISEYIATDATILTGSTAGGNTITGGAGADTITGGALEDTITGGTGADIITGGGGNDTFVYASNSDSFGSSPFVEGTADWIKDFTANGVSGDRINLGGIVETVGGNVTGTVNKATMNNDMTALLDSNVLTDGWNVNNGSGIDAALVYIDGGDMAGRSFIAVALTNNDWFGANDLLIEVTGITETAFDINVFM